MNNSHDYYQIKSWWTEIMLKNSDIIYLDLIKRFLNIISWVLNMWLLLYQCLILANLCEYVPLEYVWVHY